jgi:hypothetical protein
MRVPGVEGSQIPQKLAHECGKVRTGHLYLQEIYMVLISVKRLRWPRGHSAARRIMSMKNSDVIENRTRDLPVCSAVPQPTAPPRAPLRRVLLENVHVTVANLIVKFMFFVKIEGSEGPTTTRNQSKYFWCYPRHNCLEMTLIYPRSFIYRHVYRKSTTTITYVPKI